MTPRKHIIAITPTAPPRRPLGIIVARLRDIAHSLVPRGVGTAAGVEPTALDHGIAVTARPTLAPGFRLVAGLRHERPALPPPKPDTTR